MKEKIIGQFGQEFFDAVEQKTDSLYYLNQGDREAKFGKTDNSIYQFFYCNLDESWFEEGDSSKVIYYFEIDEKGRIENLSIKKHTLPEQKIVAFGSELKTLVTEMPDWSPAIDFGKPVRQGYTFPLILSHNQRNKYCN
ncbi:MAG: hypothetical protein GYB31_18175 [Bacteroidetes bacterium]|nr:hypothetical protein [Bacteroidota bacterium]